jgi:hypothetical protein
LASNYYTGSFPAANLTGTLATNNLAASGNGGQGNLLVEGSSTQAVFTNFGMVAGLRYVLTNTGSGVTAVPTYVGYYMELTASNATTQTATQPTTNWMVASSNVPSGVTVFNPPVLTGQQSNIVASIAGSIEVTYQSDASTGNPGVLYIFSNNVVVWSMDVYLQSGASGTGRGAMTTYSSSTLAGDKWGGGASLTATTNRMLRLTYKGP